MRGSLPVHARNLEGPSSERTFRHCVLVEQRLAIVSQE